MTTFKTVEFHHEEQECIVTDFTNYKECYKTFKKQIQSWKELAEETIEGTISIKKHTPHCYSLYQDDKVKLTWELIVIPE